MADRFRQHFYSTLQYKQNIYDRKSDPNGYLFANGVHKTKILEADLPEYFVRIYIYGAYNYLSAKGVRHLHYSPNYFTKHRCKDDALYISYDKEIVDTGSIICRIQGYDDVIFGPDISTFVDAAEKYSSYDVSAIRVEMTNKEKWFEENREDWQV